MENEQLFIKGFNNGYILAKYEPVIADKVISVKATDDYMNGIKSGRSEYLLEKAKTKLKSKPISKTKDRGRSK